MKTYTNKIMTAEKILLLAMVLKMKKDLISYREKIKTEWELIISDKKISEMNEILRDEFITIMN